MRAGTIGRWVGRAATVALIGVVGALTGIAIAGSSAPASAPVVRADFTWDSIERTGSPTNADATTSAGGGLQTLDFTWD